MFTSAATNIDMDRLHESDGGCEVEDLLNKKDSAIVVLNDHQSSYGSTDPTNNRCFQFIRNNKKCALGLCITIATVTIGYGVLAAKVVHNKSDCESQHNASLATVEQYIQSPNVEKVLQKDDDYSANPNGLCYPNICKKCSINIPANTSRLEGRSCPYRKQECYRCNDTCLEADVIREKINEHINCNNFQTSIDCCIVLSVSGDKQCGYHGDLVCINSTYTPVCQCHLGWTGPFCNKTDLVKTLCKCDVSNQTMADENKAPNCSSVVRPKDWLFCIHWLRNGSKCICANNTSGFFNDEKGIVDCFYDIPHERPHEHYSHP
ncbi:uncharacterized protein LOC127837763 isoform X2 [Dreissena polymorpha]|uniref:uncharacterized protein LOC127837763 isoform X2 n=1 Tax=Dreissena polymorpha TaxID=45954 RepID=UPI002263C3F6|nr:uncharacterized protein LOC127837763 isoform X2 [Dreissena polymorpha]